MTRLVVLVLLTLLAVGVAWALQRRRPEAPSAPSYRAPRQIDRDDFDVPLIWLWSWSSPRPRATRVRSSGTRSTRSSGRAPGPSEYKCRKTPICTSVTRSMVSHHLGGRTDGVVHASFFGPVEAERITEALDELPTNPLFHSSHPLAGTAPGESKLEPLPVERASWTNSSISAPLTVSFSSSVVAMRSRIGR